MLQPDSVLYARYILYISVGVIYITIHLCIYGGCLWSSAGSVHPLPLVFIWEKPANDRLSLQVREPSAVVGTQFNRSVEHCWSSSKSWWLITALRAWSRCRPMWVLWTASHVSDRISVLNCQTGGVSRVHLTGGWALHAVLLNCSRVCPWLYLFRCSPSLLYLLSHPP